MRRGLAVLFVTMIGLASQAHALSCLSGQSPFTDINDADTFCAEALWLKNALVTQGCTATTYCPTQTVTRAQMALFMNRLATATTPDVFMFVDSNAPQGDLDTGGVFTCRSNPYVIPPSANGRLHAALLASVSILTSGDADISATAEINIGGNFFTLLGGSQFVHVPGNQWTPLTVLAGGGIQGGIGGRLSPGAAYQWRVKLVRMAGPTTGDVTNTKCQLKVNLPVDPVAQ